MFNSHSFPIVKATPQQHRNRGEEELFFTQESGLLTAHFLSWIKDTENTILSLIVNVLVN